MNTIFVEHGFHAVGQGIFGFGEVALLNTREMSPGNQVLRPTPSNANLPQLHFSWVYDCGTHSGAPLRSKRIKAHANKLNGRDLDLLTI